MTGLYSFECTFITPAGCIASYVHPVQYSYKTLYTITLIIHIRKLNYLAMHDSCNKYEFSCYSISTVASYRVEFLYNKVNSQYMNFHPIASYCTIFSSGS